MGDCAEEVSGMWIRQIKIGPYEVDWWGWGCKSWGFHPHPCRKTWKWVLNLGPITIYRRAK